MYFLVQKKTRISVLLVLLSVLALTVVFAPAVFGQEEAIKIVSQEVQNDFPDKITFKVTATGPDTIEEIRLFFRPLGSNRSTYGYLEIDPGVTVSGEHVMLTGTGVNHKPPGTIIRYSIEVRDAAGRVLRTPETDHLYLDESLNWKSISDEKGLLTVYYYGDFVERRAQTVLEATQATMELMGPVLGIQPTEPMKIVSYSNYRDMVKALPFRSQAVREGLETQGTAFPIERVVLVLGSDPTVIGIASHEFTHIMVAEAGGRGYAAIPAWLNEGLAEFGNLDPTPSYDRALAYGVFTRRLKPLWYLDSFTGDPDDIVIAYGHGKSVVRFLIEVYGQDKMAELMRAFHTAVTADQALTMVYGFDQHGLDSQWRQAIGLDPLPPPGELTQQLTPGPSPTAPIEAESATPAPSPEAIDTPEPGEAAVAPEGSVSDEDTRRGRSSCSAPSSEGSGAVPLDLVALALLGGPFIALRGRWVFGSRRFPSGLRPIRWVRERFSRAHRR